MIFIDQSKDFWLPLGGQSEASIQIMWSLLTNQRPVLPVAGSLNLWPLPALGLSTTSWSAAGAGLDLTSLTASGRLLEPPLFLSVDQSEASIHVTWSLLTNQRPVRKSHDLSWPIRGQCFTWGCCFLSAECCYFWVSPPHHWTERQIVKVVLLIHCDRVGSCPMLFVIRSLSY